VLVAVLIAVCAVEAALVVSLAVLLLVTRRRLRTTRASLVQTNRQPPLSPAGMAMKAVAKTAARVRDQGLVGGLLASSLDDLTRWMTEQRSDIAKVAAPDGTVAIFFSDIENSTALNEGLGDARWMRVLSAHDAVVRRAVENRGGHVVKSQGDGFMVVFGDPAEAAQSAIDVQQALATARGRSLRQTRILVRIGLHVGETVTRKGDYFGRNVAMAARVAAEAVGGEVLVSDEVRAALADEPRFEFEPRGEVELKGLADLHTLWLLRH
jgi:class 3 adenylate cyclase